MSHCDDYEEKRDRQRAEAAYERVAREEKLDRATLTFLSYHWRSQSGITPGTTYLHEKSGDVYVALGITLREADLQPLVRYHLLGFSDCELSRPLDEWRERFRRVHAKTVYE